MALDSYINYFPDHLAKSVPKGKQIKPKTNKYTTLDMGASTVFNCKTFQFLTAMKH